MDRIIGKYTGEIHGPLLIAFGGMHGNEPAGVKALELVLKMIEVEPITNPAFKLTGQLLALRGNIKALKTNKRFIKKDLNRQWSMDNIDRVLAAEASTLDAEDQELKELVLTIRSAIDEYQPTKIIALDLHTTTAMGGVFTIVTNDSESRRIGLQLYAPVVTGLLDGISGTSLHYFTSQNFGIETIPVCFESGQHQEPLSVNRAIAGIVNCMRTIGMVHKDHVENLHDQILIDFTKSLPKITKLLYCHAIKEEDRFKMLPGYKNFDKIELGEHLADDNTGPIRAKNEGLILMPLYQKQGDDGFFIIQEIQE